MGLAVKQSISYQSPTGWAGSLQFDLQYCDQDIRLISSEGIRKSGLPFQPQLQTGFQARAGKQGLSLSVSGMHQSKRMLGFQGGGNLPAFRTLDLGLDWKHNFSSCSVKFFAEAGNIFNTSYFLIPAFPMPGRNFRIGTSFTLL
jgi:outer membrane receptor protein involved in Fe transport